MRRVVGVSALVDGCDGLIRQKANRAYRRVSAAHRRWIDPEDLVQEAVLAAFTTEKDSFSTYNPKGTRRVPKFSTFLHRKLDWHLSRVVGSLRYAKRDGAVYELDAPVSNDASSMPLSATIAAASVPYAYGAGAVTVHDKNVLPVSAAPAFAPEFLDAARAFIALCRNLSDPAIAVMIRGFIFSDSRYATPEICAEIGQVAGRLRIGINDLRLVGQDENVQKIVLTLIGRHVMIKEGTEEALKLLRCQVCDGRFSLGAVREERFFVFPMTCRACLRKMQRQPADQSCFGKVKTPSKEGYAPTDVECRVHCIDRVACKKFVKEPKMSEKNSAVEAVDEIDLSEVEESTKKVADKKKAKAKANKAATASAKSDKPGKKEPKKSDTSKSATKEAELVKWEKDNGYMPYADVPKGLTEWPYRRQSQMLYVFQQMFQGVSKNKIRKEVIVANATKDGATPYNELSEKQIKNGERSWKNTLKTMSKFEHKKHTWKLDEEGDTYKIHDVKFTGGAKKPASKKKAAA